MAGLQGDFVDVGGAAAGRQESVRPAALALGLDAANALWIVLL